MKVIQIDITNACYKKCTHCTRFCGHHKEPFFMDFETFKKAVDSLSGYRGVIGIMGGEPTMHPEFAKFTQYLKDNVGYDDLSTAIVEPTSDFLTHYLKTNYDIRFGNRRGLWTMLGNKYYEHFELINDTFHVQLINDHVRESWHQTLMCSRKELGISDEEWIPMRDNCWIQNRWSASITPKGAFFCEVAAAMDATLNGPGGWPIESGWWRRTPEDFKDQLHWCEMCSAALPMAMKPANSEVDDVSPMWHEKLVQIDSPKLKKGKIELLNPVGYNKDDHEIIYRTRPYMEDQTDRIGAPESMFPRRILYVLMRSGTSFLRMSIALNKGDDVISAGEGDAWYSIRKYAKDWVLLIYDEFTPAMQEMIKTCVYNPGVIYENDALTFFNIHSAALQSVDYADDINFSKYYPPEKRVKLAYSKDVYKPTKLKMLKKNLKRRIVWLYHWALGHDTMPMFIPKDSQQVPID